LPRMIPRLGLRHSCKPQRLGCMGIRRDIIGGLLRLWSGIMRRWWRRGKKSWDLKFTIIPNAI
jgi:hypothetical protein